MTFETFKVAVEQCRQYAHEVNFSFFGEPTLHPEYFKFFRHLKGTGLGVVLNTNLSLVTREIFDLWNEVNVKQCRFSIDAVTPDTFDVVRPGGPPKNLAGEFVKGERRLPVIERKVRNWFATPHRPTRHVFVVCEGNKKEAMQFAQKWQPLLGDQDEIIFKNVLTYGGVIHKDTPEFQSFIKANPCNVWVQDSLTIDWQGNVTPCNLDVNMALTIGNIRDKNLGALHKGEEWSRISKLSKERKISPCNTCVDANNWTNNVVIKKDTSLSVLQQGLGRFGA